MSGAPARGTAPRIPRRHHHHHHHHHHQNNNPPQSQDRRRKPDDKSITSLEESRPKVNPIFLWALQREQRIIEVRCEDYDKRNRIKLTKTAQGWRSIPRTASNVYTTSLTASRNLNNNCESPAALSSAASSPASSRWSPATISSSTNPAWSVSSTRSIAISSPTAEDEEMPSRNHSEEESTNDFDDTRKNTRKKRRRERRSESEKRRKTGSSSMVNSDVVTDEDSINDVEDNSSIYGRKKRRRMKKSREHSRTPLASSPRSWELLMNGTRFLNRGPAADRREEDKEDYEVNATKIQGGHFDSIDLEKAKRDQHLQPRVVLEQLHLSRPSNTIGINHEAEVEKHQEGETEEDLEEPEEEEEEEEVEEQEEREGEQEQDDQEEEQEEEEDEEDDHIEEEIVESREKPIPDKPEIRDILSMLDSTGSPVLATDTPSAHLPSSHDSTKTNISSCYESRDYQNSSRQSTCRDESEEEKINERTLQNSYKSNAKATKTITQDSRSFVTSNTAKGNNRKDNANTELSSNELGSSSEILEALRSTPGLSVSVTTRHPAETRLEIPESTATTRIATKRPSSSALYLDRLLPRTPTITGTPCCSSSEVTCSEDARNELTLKGILATPSRGHVSGPGLAAVVNRLANRRNDLLRPEARSQNDDTNRANRKESSSSSNSSSGAIEGGNILPKRPRITETVRSRAEPAKQLRELVGSSGDAIPDPLLVPRDRLPALAAAPATEIPKLLASRPELRLPEALTRPDLLRDPDLLVISLAHLQHVLDNGDGPVSDYKYRPPHPLAMPVVDPEDDDVDEEDELVEEDEEDEDDDDDEEEEDQDVPEQSLDLVRNSVAVNGVRSNVRGSVEDNSMRIQRVPPKLISCKPIGTLMPGPIDLSRNCIRSIIPSRGNQTMVASIPGIRQQDVTLAQLPPPPLLRVRTGLLKQESEVTSTEVSNNPCVQDDSHLWHPLFGSQKRQRQVQAQQQQQQQQQQHRNSWHRTTLAS